MTFAQCAVARLSRRKPIGDAFLDFVLQVELQFLLQFLFHTVAAQNGPEP